MGIDEICGGLFLFGFPILLICGWFWASRKITGKTMKERAFDLQVKRAREYRLMGEVDGMIVRRAFEDDYRRRRP